MPYSALTANHHTALSAPPRRPENAPPRATSLPFQVRLLFQKLLKLFLRPFISLLRQKGVPQRQQHPQPIRRQLFPQFQLRNGLAIVSFRQIQLGKLDVIMRIFSAHLNRPLKRLQRLLVFAHPRIHAASRRIVSPSNCHASTCSGATGFFISFIAGFCCGVIVNAASSTKVSTRAASSAKHTFCSTCLYGQFPARP
jgi:hypothetical protein